jgi:hypothetical protein
MTTLIKTSTTWTSEDPVLAQGQMGHESDTGLSKIGDGTTAWTDLAFGDPITEYSTVSGITVCVIDQTMPLIKNYFGGLRLRLRFTSANIGAVTIDLNGFGAKSVRKNVSTVLSAGDIAAGQIVDVVYDAINGWFQLISTMATSVVVVGTLTPNVATMGSGSNSVTDSTWAYSGNTLYPRTNGSDIGDGTHRVTNFYAGTNAVTDYVTGIQWNQSGTKKYSMVDVGGGMTRIQFFNSSYFAADATLGWKINDSTDAINIITFNNDGTITQAANNLKIASRINLSNASNSYFLANATLGFLVNNAADGANLFRVTNAGVIDIGNWQASLISSTYGGTGVNNAGRTITINSNNAAFTFNGAFTLTVPATGIAALGTGATGTVAYWTGTNTLSTDSNFLWNATNDRLTVGGAEPTVNVSAMNVRGSNGLNIQQTTTSSYTALFLTESASQYGGLQRLNSAFVGNYGGTSLAQATHVNFFTISNSQPFTISGSLTYSLAGATNTNCGWVNGPTGMKVCELLDIHNAPTEWFSVRKDQTGAATISSLINAGNGTAARAYLAVSNSSTLATALFIQSLAAAWTTSGIRVADAAVISTNKAAGMKIGTTTATTYTVYTNDTAWIQTTSTGLTFFGGTTTATAWAHYAAGTTTIAPNRFTSGTLTTGANILAGNFEFLTDDFYLTISTGPARKGIVLNDGTNLVSGRMPFATTNGRLIDDASITYSTSTGLTTTKDITLSGSISTKRTANAQITANQNNYAIGAGTLHLLNSDASRDITGIAGGADGRWLILPNVGSFNIVFKHNNGSSAAGNQFFFSTSGDITVAPGGTLVLFYDIDAGYWRDMSVR